MHIFIIFNERNGRMEIELYNDIIISPTVIIRHYLITEKLCEEYSDLNSYGVRIEKIHIRYGGLHTTSSREINNLFFKKNDAEKFLTFIRERKTYPSQLKPAIDEFVRSNYIMLATI